MANLLRAPLKLQKLIDLVPLVLAEVATAVAAVIPCQSRGVGDKGSVSTRMAKIAFLLAVEGAWMPAKFLCDRGME
jgi:hypothetical protein